MKKEVLLDEKSSKEKGSEAMAPVERRTEAVSDNADSVIHRANEVVQSLQASEES